jgi:hypothetical protein
MCYATASSTGGCAGLVLGLLEQHALGLVE